MSHWSFSTAVVVLLFAGAATGAQAASAPSPVVQTISLDGPEWSVHNANMSFIAPSTVPGDVYGDLMRSGLIGEPFYRYNDENYRWIAYDNWTFSRNFTISGSATAFASVDIVFEGLQIVADVFVNDHLIGSSRDQFQLYVFSVTPDKLHWHGTANVLRVAFTSSVVYATAKYDEYPSPKPHAPAYIMGLPHRNFVRGEQSSFGWDWGPAFAPQGIYKSAYVRLMPAGSVHFDYVVPHIFPMPFNQTVTHPLTDSNNSFWVDLWTYVTAPGKFNGILTATIGSDGLVSNTSLCVGEHTGICRMSLWVSNVALWWPNGYGRPALHELNVQFNDTMSGALLAVASKRIGFRSVELITFGDPLSYQPPTQEQPPQQQQPHDGAPEDDVRDRPVMFYRINGIPIFAKGANVVPFDAFQSRVNKSVMEVVLDSAVDAHMNMVRVWGGGIFPLDVFYDMCDEKGLMVWQEMIFACAEYPIDAPFLKDVRTEISHQLRRLGHHASIMVWSGNNENGIYDKGPGSPYEILDYDNVMAQIIREDTSRPIWPSSPSRGFKSGVTASGLPAGTMNHPAPFVVGGNSGDTHFYNYFTCPNISVYPRSNFGSEFGFQSLPWLDNFASVSLPKDWSLFSDLMNHRQHHPDGNAQIAALLHQNFRVPDLNSTALDIFKRVIFLSQLQQTLCIADEASFYRRGRDEPYRTMGSLYWQLNQNWQAPSWTSLEYGGEWKILHYAMKEVYAPLHISAFFNESADLLVAHVASDHLTDIVGVTATIELIPFDATAPASTDDFVIDRVANLTLGALRGTIFWSGSFSMIRERFQKRCPTAGDCFLYFSLKLQTAAAGNGEEAAAFTAHPMPLWLTLVKNLNLAPATVNITYISHTASEVTIRVEANATAPYLFIEAPAPYSRLGHFDANGFVLVKGRPAVVTWRCVAAATVEGCKVPRNGRKFVAGMVAQTLNDMWN